MTESGIVSAVTLSTKFANPVREDKAGVFKRYNSIRKSPNIESILNAVPYMSAILNEHHQVIFCNTALLDLLSIPDIADVLGMRPGEIVHCIHSDTEPYGCGTSENCQVCGAVRTVLRCFREGKATQGEAHLTTGFDHLTQPFDIMVTANPFKFEGYTYVIVTIRDISDEKRRQSLETVFVHDIANVIGGIVGIVDLLQARENIRREDLLLLSTTARQLYDEMRTQQQLMKAENNELELQPCCINVTKLLNDVATFFKVGMNNVTRTVEVRSSEKKNYFYSDRTLLFRVLCNMLKNAIEASGKNEPVSICSEIVDDTIIFKVHNRSFIPYKVQLQVFQRSFSTHGKGRGLGTYSMKLLSERYLQGKVYFRSTEDEGTTFYASYPIDLRNVH